MPSLSTKPLTDYSAIIKATRLPSQSAFAESGIVPCLPDAAYRSTAQFGYKTLAPRRFLIGRRKRPNLLVSSQGQGSAEPRLELTAMFRHLLFVFAERGKDSSNDT